jgi:hypothetical protein
MKLLQTITENKYGPPPQERSKRIEYFKDAIIFLTKINKKKHNPKINSIIRDMEYELDILSR